MLCVHCGKSFVEAPNKICCSSKCVKDRYEKNKYIRACEESVKIVVIDSKGEILKYDDTFAFRKAQSNINHSDNIVLFGMPHTSRAAQKVIDTFKHFKHEPAKQSLERFIKGFTFGKKTSGMMLEKKDPLSSDAIVEAIELIREGTQYCNSMQKLSQKSGIPYAAICRIKVGREEPTPQSLEALRACVEELRNCC
jgi:hypothetical protein